jgi:hypothetical protein
MVLFEGCRIPYWLSTKPGRWDRSRKNRRANPSVTDFAAIPLERHGWVMREFDPKSDHPNQDVIPNRPKAALRNLLFL